MSVRPGIACKRSEERDADDDAIELGHEQLPGVDRCRQLSEGDKMLIGSRGEFRMGGVREPRRSGGLDTANTIDVRGTRRAHIGSTAQPSSPSCLSSSTRRSRNPKPP